MKRSLLLLLWLLPASWLLAQNGSIADKPTALRLDTAPGILGHNEQGVPGLFVKKGGAKAEFKRLDGTDAAALLAPKPVTKPSPAVSKQPAKAIAGKSAFAPSATASSATISPPGKIIRGDSARPRPPMLGN